MFCFAIYSTVQWETIKERQYSLHAVISESNCIKIKGTVTGVEKKSIEKISGFGDGAKKKKSIQTSIYLKNIISEENNPSISFHLNRLLISYEGCVSLYPGNQIILTGYLKEIPDSTNPGQFNLRNYYKEKNIYYMFDAKAISITSSFSCFGTKFLCGLKEKLSLFYKKSLCEKQAGIVQSMILGEKNLLDMDTKTLYQTSGIGHLLAISGLHISILCMAVYNVLYFLRLPKKISAVITVVILIAYGQLTGFSISTSRAVIMMIVYLMAEFFSRTYDRKSALAFAGIAIILQKVNAVFSCSFLLSFLAVAGLELLLPALQILFYGNEEQQFQNQIRQKKLEKERICSKKTGKYEVFFLHRIQNLKDLFLVSCSIQLATLPVLLWFFYEFPPYSILLNLFILPVLSILLLLAFSGGLIGILFYTPGKFLMGGVHYVLCFYDAICRLFGKLPYSNIITGRPHWYVIMLYYVVLFLFLCYVNQKKVQSFIPVFLPLAALCALLHASGPKGLRIIFLDVGQGDGIVIENSNKSAILIDGGSSTASQVGQKRILPLLKYYGIHKLDAMIMTHADQDHISGQTELLENYTTNGIKIGTLAAGDIANPQEGYNKILALATQNNIPILKMHSGFQINQNKLQISCVNPDKGFSDESSNAGSITLDIRYGATSYLLTGDLEGEGEEAVCSKLMAKTTGRTKYTLLKVAHHGSKNSSSMDFLKAVSPEYSIISAGKNNRYGHPHQELLQRLKQMDSQIKNTQKQGAILTLSNGKNIEIKGFLE